MSNHHQPLHATPSFLFDRVSASNVGGLFFSWLSRLNELDAAIPDWPQLFVPIAGLLHFQASLMSYSQGSHPFNQATSTNYCSYSPMILISCVDTIVGSCCCCWLLALSSFLLQLSHHSATQHLESWCRWGAWRRKISSCAKPRCQTQTFRINRVNQWVTACWFAASGISHLLHSLLLVQTWSLLMINP